MAKVKMSDEPPGPSPDMERKYQVEDGLRALKRAHEVMEDKGLMKDIAKKAEGEAADFSKIAGLVSRGLISEKQAGKMKAKAEASADTE